MSLTVDQQDAIWDRWKAGEPSLTVLDGIWAIGLGRGVLTPKVPQIPEVPQ